MSHSYLEDIRKIVDALTIDDGLMLEEKLILLGMVSDFIKAVKDELEDELAAEEGGGN